MRLVPSDRRYADFDQIVKMEDPPHMFLLDWCADYPDANNFLNEVFAPAKSLFHFNWENDAFENLVNRAAREKDATVRKALFQQTEKVLCQDEAVVIPIFYDLADSLVKPRIKGWYHMAIGGQHIRNWSLTEQ
jgi:oligopeptide transport system substrate-binding protein